MFDLEGMPPHLDELDKIYLWGTQVFGEKPSEFTVALSGFGPTATGKAGSVSWQMRSRFSKPTVTFRWYIGHPTSKPICVGTLSASVTSTASLPVWRRNLLDLLTHNERIGRPAFAEFQPQGRRGLCWVRAQGSRIRRRMGDGDVHRSNGNERRGKAKRIDGQNRRL